MKTRQCSRCKEPQPLENFYYNRTTKDNLGSHCKICTKLNLRKSSSATRTLDTQVYLLPKENYVGISNNLTSRLRNHHSLGKIVENCRILASFAIKEDAKELENFLHDLGYAGNKCKQRQK
jgi:hypothetical protein